MKKNIFFTLVLVLGLAIIFNTPINSLPSNRINNVKYFGAKGDGISDDTRAIQNAIDNLKDGGIVFFPKGTYIIDLIKGGTGFKHAIDIKPGVKFVGSSADSSIIKLKNNAGNYFSLFTGKTQSSDLTGFSMFDLTVDANTTNNPINNQINSYNRACLTAYVGNKFDIERCKFIDINSIQTIELGGSSKISNCRFEQSGSGNIYHDHSTIYITSNNMKVINNTFAAPASGLPHAITAIETHGSNQIIEGNSIINYKYGFNITGVVDSNDSINSTITNNNVIGCLGGVVLWSYNHGLEKTDASLKNITVTNNNIKVDRDPWNNNEACGIFVEETSNSSIKGLNISNNNIYYEPTALRLRGDDNSSGIKVRTINHNVLVEDVVIADNMIINSICSAINLSTSIKEVEVSNNTIINSGETRGSNYLESDNKKGIYILPNTMLQDITVIDNTIVDEKDNNQK